MIVAIEVEVAYCPHIAGGDRRHSIKVIEGRACHEVRTGHNAPRSTIPVLC